MRNFDRIRAALLYIDAHLDAPLELELLARRFHFSAFYFHRLFTAVVGMSLAAHVRERRLHAACRLLAATDERLLPICLACGFQSPQAFARAFKARFGISPSAYRSGGFAPKAPSVDELIVRFTNRLQGGILLDPTIIKRGRLRIAGAVGDGAETAEIWDRFMAMQNRTRRASESYYEIRVTNGEHCTCYVGYLTEEAELDPEYAVFEVPPSKYASFDVYVSQGYDSENPAMESWLESNPQGYRERLLGDAHYCVEFYDERFHGESVDSIVEIWIPIQKPRGKPCAPSPTGKA